MERTGSCSSGSCATIKVYGRLKPYDETLGSSIIEYDIYDRVSAENTTNSNSDCLKSKLVFTIKPSGETINNKIEQQIFRFCKVFDQDSEQSEIFEVVAKPVVDSVLEGYNGTIFAYGQTGSGKTHSITGGPNHYDERGIIPRSIQHVFDAVRKMPTDTLATTYISYCEIYNETGYDLLDAAPKARKKLEDLPRVTISEDLHGNFLFRNLILRKVESEEEALDLLFLGDSNRVTAETVMNKCSSRSHCVFTIVISTRSESSGIVRRSKLNLVDLAGSERVAKTGINGKTLEEAKNINLSLHFLEQVIVSLNSPESKHIPYRNSMMTIVLKDSLGGNCLTTMLATLAAEQENFLETTSTCRFAQRVALIENEVFVNEELDPQIEVKILREDIKVLKNKLKLVATSQDDGDELTLFEISECDMLVKDIMSQENINGLPKIPLDMRKIKRCIWLLAQAVAEVRDTNQIESGAAAPQGDAGMDTRTPSPNTGTSTDINKNSNDNNMNDIAYKKDGADRRRKSADRREDSVDSDEQSDELRQEVARRTNENMEKLASLRKVLKTSRNPTGNERIDEFIAQTMDEITEEERYYRSLLALGAAPRETENALMEQIEMSKLKMLYGFRSLCQDQGTAAPNARSESPTGERRPVRQCDPRCRGRTDATFVQKGNATDFALISREDTVHEKNISVTKTSKYPWTERSDVPSNSTYSDGERSRVVDNVNATDNAFSPRARPAPKRKYAKSPGETNRVSVDSDAKAGMSPQETKNSQKRDSVPSPTGRSSGEANSFVSLYDNATGFMSQGSSHVMDSKSNQNELSGSDVPMNTNVIKNVLPEENRSIYPTANTRLHSRKKEADNVYQKSLSKARDLPKDHVDFISKQEATSGCICPPTGLCRCVKAKLKLGIATEALATEAVANEEFVTEAVASEEFVTEAVASEEFFTEAVASEEFVTEAVASEEFMTEAVASEEFLTEAVASEEFVTEDACSKDAENVGECPGQCIYLECPIRKSAFTVENKSNSAGVQPEKKLNEKSIKYPPDSVVLNEKGVASSSPNSPATTADTRKYQSKSIKYTPDSVGLNEKGVASSLPNSPATTADTRKYQSKSIKYPPDSVGLNEKGVASSSPNSPATTADTRKYCLGPLNEPGGVAAKLNALKLNFSWDKKNHINFPPKAVANTATPRRLLGSKVEESDVFTKSGKITIEPYAENAHFLPVRLPSYLQQGSVQTVQTRKSLVPQKEASGTTERSNARSIDVPADKTKQQPASKFTASPPRNKQSTKLSPLSGLMAPENISLSKQPIDKCVLQGSGNQVPTRRPVGQQTVAALSMKQDAEITRVPLDHVNFDKNKIESSSLDKNIMTGSLPKGNANTSATRRYSGPQKGPSTSGAQTRSDALTNKSTPKNSSPTSVEEKTILETSLKSLEKSEKDKITSRKPATETSVESNSPLNVPNSDVRSDLQSCDISEELGADCNDNANDFSQKSDESQSSKNAANSLRSTLGSSKRWKTKNTDDGLKREENIPPIHKDIIVDRNPPKGESNRNHPQEVQDCPGIWNCNCPIPEIESSKEKHTIMELEPPKSKSNRKQPQEAQECPGKWNCNCPVPEIESSKEKHTIVKLEPPQKKGNGKQPQEAQECPCICNCPIPEIESSKETDRVVKLKPTEVESNRIHSKEGQRKTCLNRPKPELKSRKGTERPPWDNTTKDLDKISSCSFLDISLTECVEVDEDFRTCSEIIPCGNFDLTNSADTRSNTISETCHLMTCCGHTPNAMCLHLEEPKLSETSININDLCLTGDPEIDEEIIAFYKSRNSIG